MRVSKQMVTVMGIDAQTRELARSRSTRPELMGFLIPGERKTEGAGPAGTNARPLAVLIV